MVHIFCNYGAPVLLHSDNGREFVNQVIHALLELWPECKMINGKARHSQSQGSVERCNRDIENMLACWQRDTNSNNWSRGLQFVQYAKNARHHTGIGRSPFMAHMGVEASLGVQKLNLDRDILEGVISEEELDTILPLNNPVDNLVEIEPEVQQDELNTSLNNNELEDAEYVLDNINEPSSVTVTENTENTSNVVESIAVAETEASTAEDLQVCISCGGNFTPSTAASAQHCTGCQGLCHSACITNTLCILCTKQCELMAQRQGAKRKQQEQADKMLERSAKRFKEAEIDDTVLVPIPDIDRGRCEYPNLKAVVLEMHSNGHLWKLGCKSGVLDQWYSRNQFQPTLEKFLTVQDVPMEKEVSLRMAARLESIGGGQGFFKCNCTGNCTTKRCKCFKASVKCNSRCHNQRSCTNKD